MVGDVNIDYSQYFSLQGFGTLVIVYAMTSFLFDTRLGEPSGISGSWKGTKEADRLYFVDTFEHFSNL